MYTVDEKYQDEEEEYTKTDNNGSWKENKGLIIKIIIIILCVIILIWLISALKNSNNEKEIVYDPSVHNANVTKIRLAAEKYFFTDNLPKENETKNVTLNTLINRNLVGEIVDSNEKVCNDNKSNITLKRDLTKYILKIKLSCSTNEKEESDSRL